MNPRVALKVTWRQALAWRLERQLVHPVGDLVKTWAMRGTLHLLAPDDAGIYLSVLAVNQELGRIAKMVGRHLDLAVTDV